MRGRRFMTTALVAASALAIGTSCSSDIETTATVLTPEQVAERLLTPDALSGTWAVNPGPDDAPLPPSGVIPDEARDFLPQFELCDAATDEQRAAAEALEWNAFRQLDMTPDDPIDPPNDRTGHMVFVQEFLLAGEPADIETTFGLIRDGWRACLGEVETGEEGPGVATEFATAAVGDDRYGVLTTIEEAGGGGEWLLYNTLVRDGGVLMVVDVVDIRLGDVPPQFTVAEVGDIVEEAAARLS